MRKLSRDVAVAFPQATVEVWAADEHRIGLKPILHKVWAPRGQRPLAPVQHRYQGCYLSGCVQPSSGRTVFHLASSVNTALFSTALAACAQTVGAGPKQEIVLVLERAGWHTSPAVQVPHHL